jgi:hypothetical protein
VLDKYQILKLLIGLLLLLCATPLLAREKYQSWCSAGGAQVQTGNLNSATRVMRSFPVCTITVYEAGSTKLAKLYSDSEGDPMLNPFQNQNAQTGQYFFYADNGHYDVQISATGLTTYTLRYIRLNDPRVATQLTDYFITPETYGAKGDGTTDDSMAFQSAITQAWNTGTPILLRAVAYRLAATLTLPTGENRSLAIVGANDVVIGGVTRMYATRLLCQQPAGMDCLSTASTTFANPRYRFENFSMIGHDMPYTGVNGTSGNAIKMTGMAVPQLTMRNISIDQFTGVGTAALWLDGPENGSLTDVWIQNVNECAELHTYNANSWYNVSCSYAINDGIHVMTGASFSMFGGMFQSNYRTGVHLEGINGAIFHGVHFENNNMSTTNGAGSIVFTAHGVASGSVGNFHVTVQSCIFFGPHEQIIAAGGDAGGYTNAQNMIISNYTAGMVSPAVNLDANATQWIVMNNSGVSMSDPSGRSVFWQNGVLNFSPQYLTDLQTGSLASQINVDGAQSYCRDCRNVAADGAVAGAACAVGGTGAMARREHGQWICN